MKNILTCLYIATFAILLSAAFTPSAQAATESKFIGNVLLEDILPENTLLYCRTFDLSSLEKVIDRTALGKVKNNTEVAEFLDMLTIRREEFIDKLVNERDVDRPMVDKIFNAQYSVAFRGIDPTTGSPLIYLAISFPEPPNREKLFGALKGLAWENLSKNIPAQEINIEGATVLNLPMPGINNLFFKTNNYFVLLSNLLVMTTSREALTELITNYNNSGIAKPLIKDPVFSTVRQKCQAKDSGSFVFINTRVAVPIIKFMSSPETTALIDSLGLSSIDAFGFSIDFPGEGMRHTLYLHAPRERHGILRVLKPSTGVEKISSKVPVQTSDIFSAKVDLNALYKEFPKLLEALAKARSLNIQKAFGIDLLLNKKDFCGIPTETLINTLGDYVTVHSGPSGPVLRFERADTAAFEKIVELIEKKLNSPLTSIAEGNTVVRYFNQSGSPVPVAPTYAITDKNEILVATHPQVLKGFLRQETKYILRQSKDFQQAASGLPDKMGLLYYVHSTRSYSRVYDAILPFLNVITAYKSISADPGILPPGSELEQYFFGFAIAATSEPEGITVTAYSPLGIGGTIIYGVDKIITSSPTVMSMVAAWIYGSLGYTTEDSTTENHNNVTP